MTGADSASQAETGEMLKAFLEKVRGMAESQGIHVSMGATKDEKVVCSIYVQDRDDQYRLEQALLIAHQRQACHCLSCVLSRRALGLSTAAAYSPVKGVRA